MHINVLGFSLHSFVCLLFLWTYIILSVVCLYYVDVSLTLIIKGNVLSATCKTKPYLFFLLCQLGLEAVSVGRSPLQTHVLVRDGGLQLVLLLCLLLDAVLQHLHLLHQLLQLHHLGLQLPLSRLLTEGQSGVNNLSDHTLRWNESGLEEMKVCFAHHIQSVIYFICSTSC